MASGNYKLRFYVDDNDQITKCDYKSIPSENELDILFYDEITMDQKELFSIFVDLNKKDTKHNFEFYDNYILHEFVVNAEFIRNLREKMDAYLKEKNSKKVESTPNKENKKTQNTKSPTKKRRVKRINKFNKKKVTTSILTVVTLSTLLFGVNKFSQSKSNDSNKMEPTVEVQQKDEIITKELKESMISANPNMNGLVNRISQRLIDNNCDYTLSIYADDWTGSSKYINAYNNYNDIITKYANMYGIDPKVALAIACHERGEHSSEIDSGGGLGLYQIQVSVWDNQDVEAYNFETNSWETYHIQLDNIRNLEDNVKVGMMIYQGALRNNNYNLAMSVQEYNFGHGGLLTAINAASNYYGVSRDSLMENENTDWFNFRTANVSAQGYQMGDPNYVENVFKYINNDEILTFKTPDNEIISVKYNNLNMRKIANR